MPAARRFPLQLIGAFFALYIIWGSTYLAIRIGIESWPPLMMAGVRFLIAGSLMYAFMRWRGAPAPTAVQWRSAAMIGFLLLACGNGGVTLAEHSGVASGVAALAVAPHAHVVHHHARALASERQSLCATDTTAGADSRGISSTGRG